MPLKVKKIGTSKHNLEKFALFTLYILGLNKENSIIYLCIKLKLHMINSLKANILISNNIFYTKSFSIDFVNISTQIASYAIDIVINTRHYFKFLKRRVLINIAIFFYLSPKLLFFFNKYFYQICEIFSFTPLLNNS